jgi:hypothetical protein
MHLNNPGRPADRYIQSGKNQKSQKVTFIVTPTGRKERNIAFVSHKYEQSEREEK